MLFVIQNYRYLRVVQLHAAAAAVHWVAMI